ncbi:MAG: AmmeMemoRadiSam system protein B [Anaerolineales bacterium]|nr:AmmeMemoRadiSam system protein B [Anaerolineales bacterium]
MTDIRPSSIAGTWYPGQPEALSQSIDHYLQAAEPLQIDGEVIGLITPHAGHRYSGHVAAHAFHCLQESEPKIVSVLSPLHSPHPAKVLTTAHEAYATPLGTVTVDDELLQHLETELTENWGIKISRLRNDNEHSLEIELPFLQRSITQPFKLLPIMMRDQSKATAEAVGKSLASVLADHAILIIGSTDLSHFYPQEVAEKFDKEILQRLQAFDPSGILAAEEQGIGFACGRGAMAASLWAAKNLGADSVRVLKYATSGDVTGDFQSVVGYAAAVIYRKDDH